jgi:hypothetical protein
MYPHVAEQAVRDPSGMREVYNPLRIQPRLLPVRNVGDAAVTFIPTRIAPCLPFPLQSPMTSAACLIVVSALLRELIKSADLTFVCFILGFLESNAHAGGCWSQ